MVKTGELAASTWKLYETRYRCHLKPRIGRHRVQVVQGHHLARVLRELRDEVASSWSLRGVLVAAGAIFGHAVARNWIAQSPTKRPAKAERPRGRDRRTIRLLTPEEVIALTDVAADRWRPLFVTASLTGARASQLRRLLALTWEDLNLNDGTLSISKQLSRSGQLVRPQTKRSTRTIDTGASRRKVLLEHKLKAEDKSPSAFVFACEHGSAPSYRNASRALSKAIAEAGISYDKGCERVSFHCFRHAAASAMIRAGVDPVRVAAYLGDTTEVVLSTYAKEWATKGNEQNLGDVLASAMTRS